MKKRRYRIATFNLKNLHDAETVFYGRKKYTLEQYSKKISWTAMQMDRLRAEIIGCQEVFSKKALEEVLEQTSRFSKEHIYMAGGEGDKAANALVTSLPVRSLEEITHFPESVNAVVPTRTGHRQLNKFARPVLKATVDLKGRNITVYVAHFKSQRPMTPSVEDEMFKDHAIGQMKSNLVRLYEATALRHLIQDDFNQKPHQPVLVLGDFNDDHHSPAREILLGPEPWTLWKENYQRVYYDCKLYSAQKANMRAADRQPEATYAFNTREHTMDDILISNHFHRMNPYRIGYVEKTTVLNDHLVDETVEPNMGYDPTSDHGQVVAQINLERTDARPVKGRTKFRQPITKLPKPSL